ncbi:MAG: aminoacyl-tRNA hydrolase [Thermosulfidibacteraceae bacterium]
MNVDLLIVGLGNPEPRYFTSRHNIGFMVVDLVAKSKRAEFKDKRYDSIFTVFKLADKSVCLVKPLTYMNRSGISVARWVKHIGEVSCNTLLVVHDEIDFPFGKVRFKCGGGHGGHKGLMSIMESIGTDNFARLRMGVGRPEVRDRDLIVEWLLKPMDKEDLETYFDFIVKILPSIDTFIQYGIDRANNELANILRDRKL